MARLDYSGRRKQLQQQVLEIIGEAARPAYLEAFEEHEKQSGGLLARVRNSTEGLDLQPDQVRLLETVFSDAVAGIKSTGSVYPRVLAGSESCGSAGCHQEIYKEWLPSAHRYSSLDHMFQRTGIHPLLCRVSRPHLPVQRRKGRRQHDPECRGRQ